MNASILGNILGQLGNAPDAVGKLVSRAKTSLPLVRDKGNARDKGPRVQAFDGMVVGTFAKRALAVLSQAATANGASAPEQKTLMRQMMERFAGRTFSNDEIDQILSHVVAPESLDELRSLSLGLGQDQRETLLRAALLIITADDDVTKSESRYLADLYTGFGISTLRFESIVDEALGQTRKAA